MQDETSTVGKCPLHPEDGFSSLLQFRVSLPRVCIVHVPPRWMACFFLAHTQNSRSDKIPSDNRDVSCLVLCHRLASGHLRHSDARDADTLHLLLRVGGRA